MRRISWIVIIVDIYIYIWYQCIYICTKTADKRNQQRKCRHIECPWPNKMKWNLFMLDVIHSNCGIAQLINGHPIVFQIIIFISTIIESVQSTAKTLLTLTKTVVFFYVTWWEISNEKVWKKSWIKVIVARIQCWKFAGAPFADMD